jgi:hypothetical protein
VKQELQKAYFNTYIGLFIFFVLLTSFSFYLFATAEFEMERYKVDAFMDMTGEEEGEEQPGQVAGVSIIKEDEDENLDTTGNLSRDHQKY